MYAYIYIYTYIYIYIYTYTCVRVCVKTLQSKQPNPEPNFALVLKHATTRIRVQVRPGSPRIVLALLYDVQLHNCE